MLQLDFRSRVPVYEQLIAKIKELIIHQVLRKDEQLPSVRELALEITVNPNTIQKAYRELERQGYIYSIPGKGSFVQPIERVEHSQQKDVLMAQFRKVTAELRYLGVSNQELQAVIEQIDEGGEGHD